MKTNILRALSEKPFVYLLTSEIFTQLAVNIFNFFLILIVFDKTHSNTAVSGVVLSFTIPAIIFGSLAGAYVDRWDKKKVLIVSSLIEVVLLVILAFSLNIIVAIYAVSFLFAILRQFFIPAETPLIPLIVSKVHLLSANALFGIVIYASILIAYVLSGPFIILFGKVSALLLLGFMLLLSALFISLISLKKVKKLKITIKRPHIIQEMKHTLSLVSRDKELSNAIFLVAFSQIFILIIATIAPGYAHQILKIRIEAFPVLFVAPAALGTIVGGIIVVHFFHSHPKNKVINIGIFLSAIAILLMPYGSHVTSRGFIHAINIYLPQFLRIDILHIMVVIAFLLGIANSLVFVPANTLIQERTSDEFRGRVYGFLNTIVGVLSLVPIIIVGGLADLIGVGSVLTGIGSILLLVFLARQTIKKS